MPVERAAGGTSLIDVLDRVLDKGIVIDAWVRVSLVGIDLITVEARVVVASIDTYLKYSETIGTVTPVSLHTWNIGSHPPLCRAPRSARRWFDYAPTCWPAPRRATRLSGTDARTVRPARR